MFKHSILILAVAALCGCVEVSYIGQTRPATGGSVAFYNEISDVPAGLVRIGYAELNAPDSYSAGEIRNRLIDKAEEVGASAVGVVYYRKVLVGEYTRGTDLAIGPTGNWTVMSTSGDGSDIYTDSFGAEQKLGDTTVKRYEIHVRADFYTPEADPATTPATESDGRRAGD